MSSQLQPVSGGLRDRQPQNPKGFPPTDAEQKKQASDLYTTAKMLYGPIIAIVNIPTGFFFTGQNLKWKTQHL